MLKTTKMIWYIGFYTLTLLGYKHDSSTYRSNGDLTWCSFFSLFLLVSTNRKEKERRRGGGQGKKKAAVISSNIACYNSM